MPLIGNIYPALIEPLKKDAREQERYLQKQIISSHNVP